MLIVEPLSEIDRTVYMLAFKSPPKHISCLSSLRGTKGVRESIQHRCRTFSCTGLLQGDAWAYKETSNRSYTTSAQLDSQVTWENLLNLNQSWLLLYKQSKIPSSHSRDKSTCVIIYCVLVIGGNIMTHVKEPFSSSNNHCWVWN